MVLQKEELSTITGGGLSYAVVGAIGLAISFLIGVVDGYLRPLKCN